MSKLKDITGQTFGYWTVLEIDRTIKRKHQHTHWLCRCKCGEVKIIQGGNLKRGLTSSCGCKIGENVNETAFRRVIKAYKSNAKYRGLNFELTTEQFHELVQKNCFYCDRPPSNKGRTDLKQKTIGIYIYNGLDRINCDKGYTLDNVIPCCNRDNVLRSNHFTVDETKVMIVALENLRTINGTTDEEIYCLRKSKRKTRL